MSRRSLSRRSIVCNGTSAILTAFYDRFVSKSLRKFYANKPKAIRDARKNFYHFVRFVLSISCPSFSNTRKIPDFPVWGSFGVVARKFFENRKNRGGVDVMDALPVTWPPDQRWSESSVIKMVWLTFDSRWKRDSRNSESFPLTNAITSGMSCVLSGEIFAVRFLRNFLSLVVKSNIRS